MTTHETLKETPLKVISPSFGQYLPVFLSPIFIFILYIFNANMLYVSLAFWLIELFVFFFVWFSISFTKYRLFSNRITVDHGLLNRTSMAIPLTAINNISYESNFFQRPLKLGNIRIDSATGVAREIYLVGVPEPESLTDFIFRLKDSK